MNATFFCISSACSINNNTIRNCKLGTTEVISLEYSSGEGGGTLRMVGLLYPRLLTARSLRGPVSCSYRLSCSAAIASYVRVERAGQKLPRNNDRFVRTEA